VSLFGGKSLDYLGTHFATSRFLPNAILRQSKVSLAVFVPKPQTYQSNRQASARRECLVTGCSKCTANAHNHQCGDKQSNNCMILHGGSFQLLIAYNGPAIMVKALLKWFWR
jgi:hypothetical protein